MARIEFDRHESTMGAAVPVAFLMMAMFAGVSATDLSLPWNAITAIGHWQILWGPASGLLAGVLMARCWSVLATLTFGLSVILDALSMGGSGLAEVMNIQWSNVLGGFAALWAVGGGNTRLGRANWIAYGLVGAALGVPVILHADLVDLASYALVPASWASLAMGSAIGGRLASGVWPVRPTRLAVLGFIVVMALYGRGVLERAETGQPVQEPVAAAPAAG